MEAPNKAISSRLQRIRRGVVVLFTLFLLAGAVIGIAGALHLSTATSAAFFLNPTVGPAVDAPYNLPFGLEADPAEHELYRQLDEQCREQIESTTYQPLEDCR
jgi:hypothetical protein